jgi:Flp pilus assembly protein TadG
MAWGVSDRESARKSSSLGHLTNGMRFLPIVLSTMEKTLKNPAAAHRRSRRGNTLVELALVLTPMFALLLSIVEVSLPIFKKSTFVAAVREGCRYGITYQTTYNGTSYGSQTAAIQAVVLANSMGFLTNTSDIQVSYFLSTSPYTNVTAGGSGVVPNNDGNILQVSIAGYTHNWIDPINWFYSGRSFSVTQGSLAIVALSADRLETLPVGSTRPSP